MGRCQTEASYLKVDFALAARLLDWTGGTCLSAESGAARIAALFRPEDTRCINRRAAIIDLPAFLPPRNSSVLRRG